MRLKAAQINKRNRLPLSAFRCHRDRVSTIILASFLAVGKIKYGVPGTIRVRYGVLGTLLNLYCLEYRQG